MSYRNPKFFVEDHAAFNRGFTQSFDKAFTDVYGYFQNKIKEDKEFMDNLSKTDKAGKKVIDDLNLTDTTTNEIITGALNETFDYHDDKVEVKGITGGLEGGTRENQVSEVVLQQYQEDFQNTVTSLGGIFNAASNVDMLPDMLDSGSGSFLEYNAVVSNAGRGLTKDGVNGGKLSMNFNADKKGYDLDLTIKNPRFFEADADNGLLGSNVGLKEGDKDYQNNTISYDATGLRKLQSENDPEARKIKDKGINDALFGEDGKGGDKQLIKEKLDAWEAENKGKDWYSIKGANVAGSEYIDGVVDQTWADYSREGEEGSSNFVVDIIANKLDYNDRTMYNILENTQNSSVITDLTMHNGEINGARINVVNQLLDTHPNDKSYQRNLLASLGVPRGSDEMTNALDVINKAQNNAGKKWYKEQLLKTDLGAKYVSPKKPDKPTPPKGDGTTYDGNDPYTVQYGKLTSDMSIGTVNAVSTFGANIPSFGVRLENGEKVFTNPAAGELISQQTESGFIDNILNTEFTFGGSKKNATGLDMSRDGKLTLYFDAGMKTRDITGTKEMYEAGEIKRSQIGKKIGSEDYKPQDSTMSYDMYSPESVRNLMDALGTEAGGTGEYTRNFKTKGFDTQMVANYTSPQGLLALEKPNMGEWLNFVNQKGGNKQLIDYIINKPELLESGADHWKQFARTYSKQINLGLLQERRKAAGQN